MLHKFVVVCSTKVCNCCCNHSTTRIRTSEAQTVS